MKITHQGEAGIRLGFGDDTQTSQARERLYLRALST